MNFPFTKMHGLGNDFVVFDFTEHSFDLTQERAAKIADRHFGVGCDQILIVEKSTRQSIDFKYRILNADGSEVGQCGNGARCFALYVRHKELSDKETISVETLSGNMLLKIDQIESNHGHITVDMGAPKLAPEDIPLAVTQRQDTYSIELNGEKIEFRAASMGNPHAVIVVDDWHDGSLEKFGAVLESHAFFPERVNIGFMQVIDRNNIRLRVFERGVGETIACGSGACAAVVCGIDAGLLDSNVNVCLVGGTLAISWGGEGNSVMMSGPAQHVFSGQIDL